MHGGGAEIPDERLLAAHQQREAAELVALPFADLGGGDVADVVDVEEEQRAAFRLVERGSRPRQAVGAQPVEIDAALEIHIGVAGRRDRAVPLPLRVVVMRAKGFRQEGLCSHQAPEATARSSGWSRLEIDLPFALVDKRKRKGFSDGYELVKRF